MAMAEISLILIVILIFWGINCYNRLISHKNRVFEGWSDIDVQLHRRHDLIPNLVATTKQYANYEKAVLTSVTELRTQSEKMANITKKGELENKLCRNIDKLIALQEAYPELKSNQHFLQLQEELVDIEEHIQYARRYYNGAVRNLNTAIESFPDLVIARFFAFEEAAFFQLESDEVAKAVKI